MEDSYEIEPNQNAEVFRKMTDADRPTTYDTSLQFILLQDDQSAFVGGSNFQDRYNRGSIWFFNKIDHFDPKEALTVIKVESGVTDACSLKEKNKFVVGEDSGVLQVFNLVEMLDTTQPYEVHSVGYACQHDDSLVTISTSHDDAIVVTGGFDACIRVWDISKMLSTKVYSSAHTDIVTCVAVRPKSNSVFASTSLNSEVLVWDTRLTKPVIKIFKNNCGVSAVAWRPEDENTAVIGDISGEIKFLDLRKPNDVLDSSKAFPREVHRLLFNPLNSNKLSACCDDTIVKVFDTTGNKFNSIYESNQHNDFVRGLSWYQNQLFSCSWDGRVLHSEDII